MVGAEFAAAKAEAMRAKADGDKARQRAAGEMIRSLKREMAELGGGFHQLKSLKKRPGRVSLPQKLL